MALGLTLIYFSLKHFTITMRPKLKLLLVVNVILAVSAITWLVSLTGRSEDIFIQNPTHSADFIQANNTIHAQYTELFGQAPPKGFDKWVLYATLQECSLNLSDYAGIIRDLKPFAHGIKKEDLLDLQNINLYLEVEIRNGAYYNGPHNAYKKLFYGT